jgi:exodeoxyribonuclease VII small subunit
VSEAGEVAESGAGAAPDGSAQDGADQEIPYEQARDELTDVVRRLEAGGLTLEQSLELWERGERLAGICTRWLEGARARLAAAMPAAAAPGGNDSTRGGTGRDAAAPF